MSVRYANWSHSYLLIKPSRKGHVRQWLCSYEMNYVPKDVSDRDPKRDWDRDLNYVRSHALQTPSQSQSGSAHCEVIFCSHCAVRADWPMHGFSTHFQNAHARINFLKSFAFTWPRIRLSMWITIQNALFSHFKSLIWNSFAFTRAIIRLSNQERAESRSETSFGTWFVLMWTGPLLC